VIVLGKPVSALIITIGVLFLAFQFFNSFISVVRAENEISFITTDKFLIPTKNSEFNFAFNGTYEMAYLENDFWIFKNLDSSNLRSSEKLNLKISPLDCKLTIFPFRIAYYQYGESILKWVILRYTIYGKGTQIINLGFDANNGQLDVIIDGEFVGRNQGWTRSNDGTLTITNAADTVTIWYIGYPEPDENRTLLDQHSVLFGSIFFISSIILISVFITKRKSEVNTD
jgi:hypothetical protein